MMSTLYLHSSEFLEESELRCGACEFKSFSTSDLHYHQQVHGVGGSYYFCHLSKTAYPRFELVSFGSQTEPLDLALAQALDSSDINTASLNTENSYISYRTDEIEATLRGLTKLSNSNTSQFPVEHGRSIQKKMDQRATVQRKTKQISYPKAKEYVARRLGDYNDALIDKKEKDMETRVSVSGGQEQTTFNNATENYIDGLNKTIFNDNNYHDDNLPGIESPTVVFDSEIPASHIVNDHSYEHPELVDNDGVNVTRLHKCVFCEDVSFHRKLSLLRHFKKHHNNELPFKCDKCQKFLVSPADADRHSILHNKTRHECLVCMKKFSTELGLLEHSTLHTGEKPFQCPLCPNRYSRKFSLEYHITSHSDVKSHVCEFCGKGFASRTRVLGHIKFCVKKVECTICHKKFADNCKMKIHLRKHTKEKPYVCEVCGCAFSYSSGLVRHKKFIHTKQKDFKCSVCDKSFVVKQTLDRHVKIHTSVKSCVCTYCGRSFRAPWTLKVHIRKHTGEMPYVCEFCGKRYTHNVARKKHELNCPMNSQSNASLVPSAEVVYERHVAV